MELERSLPLLWLLALLPMAAAYALSLAKRPKWKMRGAFALRALAVALLALALCQPSASLSSSRAHIVFLLDVSESVDIAQARKAAAELKGLAKSLRSGDSCSVFLLADGLRAIQPDAIDDTLKKWESGANDDKFRGATRIASSLLAARLDFPAGKAKRVVLFSDGAETASELAPAVEQLKREGVDILVKDLAGVSKPEAALISFSPNSTEAFQGETIRFEATASANTDMDAKLRISNRSVILKEIAVKLEKGKDSRIGFDYPARKELGDEWTAELVPEKDQFPLNNIASCRVKIKGGAKALALHTKPEKLRPFVKAMREQDIDVEVRGREGFPSSLKEMLDFDAVIIADFPATLASTSQMEALRSYVRDYGGGFIMTGSENSFGLGGYFKTPVEDVLPLISRYQKEKEQPSLGIVFVIDKSGSMGGEKIAMAREAAKSAIEVLGPNDYVGVVAFDGDAYKVFDISSTSSSAAAAAAIDTIAADGGTNMYPGMAMGKEMLARCPAKVKHEILLTDGQSMEGDFLGLASEMADSSMTISTVALGSDADRNLMSKIADLGKGRYYEATEADSIPRIFTKEAIEASHSAIKEEPFNPVKTSSADFLDGIDFRSAPPLFGYVMTRSRPAAKVQLLAESGDPLLASARFGLGNSAAFTSDATSQWASEWLDWKGYGKFWSQLLRAVMRSVDSSGMTVERLDSKLRVRCVDPAGNPRDFISWDIIASGQDGQERKLEARQTGCGLYEIDFKAPEDASCEIRLADKTGGQMKSAEIQAGCPKEYLLGANRQETFNSLKRLDPGGVLEGLSSLKTQHPLRPLLCMLALACLFSGILLRRI